MYSILYISKMYDLRPLFEEKVIPFHDVKFLFYVCAGAQSIHK